MRHSHDIWDCPENFGIVGHFSKEDNFSPHINRHSCTEVDRVTCGLIIDLRVQEHMANKASWERQRDQELFFVERNMGYWTKHKEELDLNDRIWLEIHPIMCCASLKPHYIGIWQLTELGPENYMEYS